MKITEWFDRKVSTPFISWWFRSTFFDACRKGDVEEIQDVVKLGLDPKIPGRNGKTALHCAGTLKVLKELVEVYGLDVNAVDKKGDTPLHVAVREGSFRAIEELLKKGANPTLKNKDGRTPRDVANHEILKETHVWDEIPSGWVNLGYEWQPKQYFSQNIVDHYEEVGSLLEKYESNFVNYALVAPSAPPEPSTPKKQQSLDSPIINYALVAPSTPPEPSTAKKQQELGSSNVTQANKKRKISHAEKLDVQRNRSSQSNKRQRM